MSAFPHHRDRPLTYSPSERSFVDELADYSELPASVLEPYSLPHLHSSHSTITNQVHNQATPSRAPRGVRNLQEPWTPSFSQQLHSSRPSHIPAIQFSIESLDHDALLQNKVYQELYHKLLSVQSKLESSQEAFNMLASMRLVPNPGPSTTSESSLQISSNTLLAPLLQRDYPAVKFWLRRTWSELKGQEVTELNNAAGPRGQSRIAAGENVSFTFIEDANGVPFNGYRIRDVTSAAREVWLEFQRQGQAPPTWGQGSATVRNFYRIKMYRRIPELRYCDNHWKVDQIATTTYSGWHRKHVLGIGKIIKKEIIPIELVDENEFTSTAQKRTSNLPATRPSKKFKIPTLLQKPISTTPSSQAASEGPDESKSTLSSPATNFSCDLLSSVSPSTSAVPLSPLHCDTRLQTFSIPSTASTSSVTTPVSPTSVISELLPPASIPPASSITAENTSANDIPGGVLTNRSNSTLATQPITFETDTSGAIEKPATNIPASPSPGIIIMSPFETATEVVATDLSKLVKIVPKSLNPAASTTNATASSKHTTTSASESLSSSSEPAVPTSVPLTSTSKGKKKPVVKKERMMVPSNALVPKNLFAVEYCKNNTITKAAFDALWDSLDDTTKQQYNELSAKTKQELKEAKARAVSAGINGSK